MHAARGVNLADRYRLVEKIGSGGAGTVWAAVDELLGRRVAVKDVGGPQWLTLEGRQAVQERTRREARAAAAIDHPNVVRVYDLIEVDGRPWIVMELVDAKPLSQVIGEHGPLTAARTAEIGLQVLGALGAAHRLGILHRDVKPSNVLIEESGRAVLTDFGIAAVDGDAALTASGMLVGAPAYIAPERVTTVSGAPPAGPASDLWSLGATLYTAVEGRPPYHRNDAISTMVAVVHDEPEAMSRAGALSPVLTALLQRDPARRPTAAQLETLLRRVAATPASGIPSATEATVVAAIPVRPAPTASIGSVAGEAQPDTRISGQTEATAGRAASQAGRTRVAILLSAAMLLLLAVLTQAAMDPKTPAEGTSDPDLPTSTDVSGDDRSVSDQTTTKLESNPAGQVSQAPTSRPSASQVPGRPATSGPPAPTTVHPQPSMAPPVPTEPPTSDQPPVTETTTAATDTTSQAGLP